jgi:hypothetical protein
MYESPFNIEQLCAADVLLSPLMLQLFHVRPSLIVRLETTTCTKRLHLCQEHLEGPLGQ